MITIQASLDRSDFTLHYRRRIALVSFVAADFHRGVSSPEVQVVEHICSRMRTFGSIH